MWDGMKAEGSPGEVGPAFASESTEAHQDAFSDDEPETELEALQHLPAEERRKALRRLRNRESARRVRARRLAEMSQMGTTLQGLQDEKTALKAHVSKLQSHIQSMTLKVYEVTAKYETVLAENAQLRAELLRFRRPSAPGDSNFMALTANDAAAAAAANGPNSAPLNQLSPFVAPMELQGAGGGGGGPGGALSAGHVQLRSRSPMDLQQQRQALEEVVMLLKEHKRRHQGVGQDRSGGSEIGSSGAGGNNANSAHSPNSDAPLAGAGAPLSGLAASGLGTNNSSNSGMPYNVGDMSRFMGGRDGCMGASALGTGRGCQSEILMGTMQHPLPLSALQLPPHPQTVSRLGTGDHAGMCSSVLSNAHNNMAAAVQPPPLAQAPSLPQPLVGNPGPAASVNLPLPGQQPQTLGQSYSHPLPQLQLPHHQQVSLLSQQQMQMQACGQQSLFSGALYGDMSALSLSAPFFSAASTMPGGGGLQVNGGHNSGPNALGSGICGIGNPGAVAQGLGGGLGSHHRSASYALDRGTCATSAQNAVAMHPTWQGGNGGNGAAGVAMLRPDDFTEDILMSLDEYVPQDL